MNFYRRRPLALALSLCILLSAAAAFISAAAKIALMAVIAIAVTVVLLYSRKRFLPLVAGMSCVAFALIAGVLSLCTVLTSYACYDLLEERFARLAESDNAASGDEEAHSHTIEANVVEIHGEMSYASTYVVRLTSLDGDKAGAKGLLLADALAGLSVGDTVRAEVSFVPLGEVYEDYDWDYGDMMASGFYFACQTADEIVKTGVHYGAEQLFVMLRSRFAAAISLYLDRDSAALSNSLLLADRSQLGVIRRDFVRIGAAHLLALSGMHLSILCGILDYILKKLRVRIRPRVVLTAVFIVFYAALTGFPDSVVRAGLMLIILNTTRFTGMDRDYITALFAAGALILLVNPPSLYDMGFTMSFAATLGVLLLSNDANLTLYPKFAEAIRNFPPLKRLYNILYSLFVSAGAVMFLIPLQCLYFGETSLLTLLSSLLLTPFCELMLFMLPFYLTISLLRWSFLAGRLAWLIAVLSKSVIALAARMSELQAVVSLRYPFAAIILIACAAAIIIMMAKNVRSWMYSLIPFGLSAAVFLGTAGIYDAVRADTAYLYFFNRKSNDSAAVVIGGSCLIADISDGTSSVIRRSVNALADEGVTEIDTLMLTHLHRRHSFQLRKLCEQRLVRRLLIPQPVSESEYGIAEDLRDAADELNIEVVYYSRPEEIRIIFGGVEIGVLGRTYIPRSTQPLIGLDFGYAGTRICYAGSSVWEIDTDFFDGAAGIILGVHGPVIKSAPDFGSSGSIPVLSSSETGDGLKITVKP